MKNNFKIWHFLILLFVLILILRFNELINIYELMYLWIVLLFENSNSAISQFTMDLFDVFTSGVLFIVLPLIFFFLRNKISFLKTKISFFSFFLILLLISFLFAPLLTNVHPDFYKNIGLTKLLPPLSNVKALHLKAINNNPQHSLEKFHLLKDVVVKKPFDENIIYIDSISLGTNNFYYANGIKYYYEREKLIFKGNQPYITNHYFILGTDQFGRDVLTRLIYGARISLSVGLGSVIISFLIGLTFGFLAGYTGGIFDTILSRTTEMFLSFPIIFFIILILALFGNSLISVIVVLGFAGWMSLFKVVKTETLSIKNKNYFISAKLLGLSKTQLLFKEVLPVIIVPVVINIIFQFGNVIIAESALSYLGLGLGENYPSWGSMIQAGQEYISSGWWMIFFPGITLIFTLLSANKFGFELNRILNPRLQND